MKIKTMPYVLVSLKHTKKEDLFITLWGKDNCGYCFSSDQAGVYKDLEQGYHDSESTLPIEVGRISKLFIEAHWDGVPKKMIPNCPAVWKELGLIMKKDGLQRV